MSFSDNPYQSPATEVYQAEMIQDQPLWRKGKLLVMHKMATLPDRCVKSNVPTKRRLKRSLYWHHPAVYLALLANVLIYVIAAIVTRKTATIFIGLSDTWFAKRRWAIFIGWTSILAAMGMVGYGIAHLDNNTASPPLIAVGFVLFLFGAIYGLVAARMVAPIRISDTHIWLKGVCPDYLRELPEWPLTP